MEQDQLFERLWNGTAPLEERTQAVADGAVTAISENIISGPHDILLRLCHRNPHHSRARLHRHRWGGGAIKVDNWQAFSWTQRGADVCRIISVRRARDEEKRQYQQIHG